VRRSLVVPFPLVCILLTALCQPCAAESTVLTGYTIPVLDVSREAARQVVVDREEGKYLGHPTTVLLQDGRTIFVVYPQGHATGALVLKRSDDGGLTWSGRLPIPENWATSVNPPSINRLRGPDGRERLVVITGSEENKKEDRPIRISISEDSGRNWTPLAAIGEGRDYNAIVAASSMLRLKDGRHMALHHADYLPGEDGRRNMKLYKMLSADGGRTWSPRIPVLGHPAAEFCEPGAVRSPDGREIAVMIRDNSRKFRSFLTFSRDEGETWLEARELPGTLTGDRHQPRYAPDGRLVVVFRDMDKQSPTRGHFVAWVGRYQDLAAGAPGQYRIKLLHSYGGADCGYAGLELLPDGTFVATTYIKYAPGEKERQSIVSVRFRLSDFDALLGAGHKVEGTRR
jgi:hypothetical protein